jgi:hypothetical protein
MSDMARTVSVARLSLIGSQNLLRARAVCGGARCDLTHTTLLRYAMSLFSVIAVEPHRRRVLT